MEPPVCKAALLENILYIYIAVVVVRWLVGLFRSNMKFHLLLFFRHR